MNVKSTGPQLIFESASAPPFSLPAGGRIVLGRSGSADLSLNDLGISRQHCALTTRDGGVQIEDLGSASGTFVNGRRIAESVKLQDGDRIVIGNTTLRFLSGQVGAAPARRAPQPAYRSAAVRDPEMTMAGQSPVPTSRQQAQSSPEAIPLRERLLIGRDAQCDMPLAGRDISRRHAEIRLGNGVATVRDLSSTNGTFVNGREVTGRVPLHEGSRLRVGSYVFLVRDGKLWPSCQKGRVRVSLHEITQTVASRETGQQIKLLDAVSLVIEPNEFVALLGPSGSGKSTLMDAMNGRRPASSGQVRVNEDDFYEAFHYYRRAIGYVPQKDIVHPTLTVRQELGFAAQLRLPADTFEAERRRIVEQTIGQLGLAERSDTLIRNLSGGQLKRVSLGVELIADPNLLFLDEATSGLDAGTEAKLMALFREIANEGKTVVCITHNVENVSLCDLVAVLAGGKLVYYGPPATLPAFFGVTKISQVYDRLETQPAEVWERQYKASGQYREFVQNRLAAGAGGMTTGGPAGKRPAEPQEAAEIQRQLGVLTRRYFTVLAQDRKNAAILLAQAPLIGLLLGMVFGGDSGGNPRLLVFLMSISAIWFGCINASREIVKELPIYLRERAVNLQIPAYLGSKVAVLSVLCSVQCLAMYLIVAATTSLPGNAVAQLATLFLTALCGSLLGLLVSALADTTDKATAIVPILLIPQVILADIVTPLGDGLRQFAQLCIVAFWSVDALVDTLPATIGFLRASHHSLGPDLFALLLFALGFAGLAAWALKRKDKL